PITSPYAGRFAISRTTCSPSGVFPMTRMRRHQGQAEARGRLRGFALSILTFTLQWAECHDGLERDASIVARRRGWEDLPSDGIGRHRKGDCPILPAGAAECDD